MEARAQSPDWNARHVLRVAVPLVAVVLSLMVWVTGVAHSGFWADDFANLTHFERSLGDLSSDQLNKGKYVINVFWGLGTAAFGTGSVVPFLLLSSSIFMVGLVMWLHAGSRARWSAVDAWWIGGLFIATAAWLPLTLWASNITHTSAFFALGAGYAAHELSMKAPTLRRSLLWSFVGGMAWTLAIVSNLLYVGLLVIALYCSVHQISRMRRFSVPVMRIVAMVSTWNLILPIVYFLTIAYPATTASSVYADNGLQFVHANFRYYRAGLAPTTLLSAFYAALVILVIAAGTAAARRRDWFPLVILAAAGATALPTFMQGQQRGVDYLSMPLLLTFSGLAAGVYALLAPESKRGAQVRTAMLVAATFMLVLIFRQGANIRAYYTQSPAGDSLAAFRRQIARLSPEGANLCVTMNFDVVEQDLLIAELSGENGFMVPPISAARAYLLPSGQACPIPQSVATHVMVSLNARGEFTASS